MPHRARTDWLSLGSVLALLVFGLLMVWSATQYTPPPRSEVPEALRAEEDQQPRLTAGSGLFFRQVGWAVLGVALLLGLERLDYRRLNSSRWAYALPAVSLALLAVVFLADPKHHRFLRVGPVGVQPSELAKPALVVFLAYFVTQGGNGLKDSRKLAQAAVTVGLMSGAVMIGDLGTAVVMLAATGVVFLVAGLQWRYFKIAGWVAAVFLLGAIAMQPYRLVRLISFLDPELKIAERVGLRPILERQLEKTKASRDPRYQLEQSLVAVGSGGAFGVGPTKGAQKLGYLPEAHNDFIFAVVGEELGFAGCFTLVVLFLLILWRGLRLARSALEDFGKYLALGATTMIVFQAFLNMSVVLGLLPTKGIPLPMISYGGSSLVSTLALFGMLLSVSERSR